MRHEWVPAVLFAACGAAMLVPAVAAGDVGTRTLFAGAAAACGLATAFFAWAAGRGDT